jgi:hypothetical protein
MWLSEETNTPKDSKTLHPGQWFLQKYAHNGQELKNKVVSSVA